MSILRKIAPMKIPGIEPGGADMPEPKFERADPTTLLVDEVYQRNLSERSVALIRKMVQRWDWRSFQPPLVVRTKLGLHVVDGQHTAIAAVTHPKIKTIPILLIEAPEVADRARAFIGRNRDRIAVTTNQLHYAAVAAGDDTATTVHQVCERAGIRILKNPPGMGAFKVGETLAVSSITALVNRRGALRARQILEVCGQAKLAPVSAAIIKAVESLMTDREYAEQVVAADLTTIIREGAADAEGEARVFAAAHSVPLWKALAAILFKRCRRGRRRAA
jgi:hypothetical protein